MEGNKAENTNVEQQGEDVGLQEDLIESNWDESVAKFEELNLHKDLLRGIFGFGFAKPSVIQQKGILPIIKEKDTIAQAQSGSGKTGTFVIGCLQRIDPTQNNVQCLILSPTRELATQTNEVVKAIGNYLGVKTHLSMGGTHVVEDKKKLSEGVHFVVGTPGRICDLLKREILVPNHLKCLVMDEADEMLGRGFLEQVNDILKLVPPETQICLFSATMPPEIIKMTENIMSNPAKILVKNENLTLEGIKQFYISCTTDDIKFDNLIEIFSHLDVNQCMIYCNTREKAEHLTEKMREKKFVVSCMHSKMTQEERNKIMNEFRTGSSRLLVSTDLLARGIDVYQVGLVINFDLPNKKENYIHRIGRSGRFGRRGIAINLITKQESQILMNIEEFYNTEISNLPTDLSEIE
jgi:translation initiation factor 4A